MRYLEGSQAPFRTAKDRKALIGKWIKYLRQCDVDKSGRGMFFPRVDFVESAAGREMIFENQNSVSASDLVEVVILEDSGDE